MDDRFAVIVGGWREVGVYDTFDAAMDKKLTCVSMNVNIVKRTFNEGGVCIKQAIVG